MENLEPVFNCNGKVIINNWRFNDSSFFEKKDLDVVLHNSKSCNNTIFNIFNFDTSGINVLLNLQHFSKCLDSKLKQFERHEKLKNFRETSDSDAINFYSLRKATCEFVYHLRNYLKSLQSEHFALKDINNEVESDFNDLIDTISKFLSRLKNIPASTFLYVSSPHGNSSKQPEYHIFHLHLDLRWLLTTLLCVKNDQWEYSNELDHDLKSCIYNTIADLIYISMNLFENISKQELQIKTPYSCTCMRELWLMLQILIDELHKKNISKPFWYYVNTVLDLLFLNENVTIEEILVIKKYGNFSDCKNPELFCIWLMYHLTLLYGYDVNGNHFNKPSNRYQATQMTASKEQVDKILKAYVGKGGKDGERDEIDEELRAMIPLLQLLSIDWGQSDFQLYALLWDCFHKRLDNPFLLQTRGPWLTSSEKKTPMDILNSVKNRLKSNYETNQESSFGLFLRLLGIFLERTGVESKTWLQLKGRIFMKITQKKLQDSSECGVYNFICLCLTLAVTIDLRNTATFMLQVSPRVEKWDDADSAKKCCLIWKSHLAILLLYHENKSPFKDLTAYFTEKTDSLSCLNDEFSRSMMVWYIDVLRIILTQNNSNFENNEHEFISGWLDRFLSDTAPNRIRVLASTLLKVFQKCTENHNVKGNILMRNAIMQYGASRIRTMITLIDLSDNFYEIPTKLGVALTIEACRVSDKLQTMGHSAAKLFVHYTTCPILKDLRVVKLFLNLVLQDTTTVQFLKGEKQIKDFDLLCVQSWIKSSMLTKDDSGQYFFLKNYIANIPTMKEILNTETDYNNFLQANESFTIFLHAVPKKRNTFKSEQEQMAFDNKCKSFLFGIERWALQLINIDNKDSKLSIWTYHCIGLIIKHWAPILYSKNPSNLLKTLITKIALPLDQQALSYRTHLTQRIFSSIILGFENLSVMTDISLQNLLRELFERYLPLLVKPSDIEERSYKATDILLECFLAKSDFTKVIFFILSKNLITLPQDQTTHAVCYLVMYLLINLIKAGKTYSTEIIDSVILECIPNILNCYCRVHDSHPHRSHTMDLLREITASSYYKESDSVRLKLMGVIWNALKKTTASQSKASFDLLNFVSKIDSELYKPLYNYMTAFVSECEKRKFPNAGTLRFLFSNLKKV